jgi:tetratricopeptide (TPR) repeat protein
MSLNNLANMLSNLGRREEALARAQEAMDLYRALAAQRPDAFRPDLATSLNTLAVMLSKLGRREEALARAQEAVDLRRDLAAQRPDAFRPDLARSLAVLANCLDARDRRADAGAADAEAIGALAGHFATLPAAFGRLMQVLARNYQTRCEALGVEPDAELLGPVVEVFERLRAEGAGTS